MKKFISTYSNNSKAYWGNDIIEQSSPNIRYTKIFNGMLYNIDCNNIHYITLHTKCKNIKLFYYNKYKTINYNDITKLPFDTEFYITREVEGPSYFATKENNKTIIYSKYGYIIDNGLILDDKLCKYLIDKHGDKYVIEFKINNNEVYIVNMFSDKEILSIYDITKIANWFNIKTPTIINPSIFTHSIDMINSYYNSYYYDVCTKCKSTDYLLTFRFRNNKYLLYKVIL